MSWLHIKSEKQKYSCFIWLDTSDIPYTYKFEMSLLLLSYFKNNQGIQLCKFLKCLFSVPYIYGSQIQCRHMQYKWMNNCACTSPTSTPHHLRTSPENICFSSVQPLESKTFFPRVTVNQCLLSITGVNSSLK